MSEVAAKAGGMQSVEKKKEEEDGHSSESIPVHQDIVPRVRFSGFSSNLDVIIFGIYEKQL